MESFDVGSEVVGSDATMMGGISEVAGGDDVTTTLGDNVGGGEYVALSLTSGQLNNAEPPTSTFGSKRTAGGDSSSSAAATTATSSLLSGKRLGGGITSPASVGTRGGAAAAASAISVSVPLLFVDMPTDSPMMKINATVPVMIQPFLPFVVGLGDDGGWLLLLAATPVSSSRMAFSWKVCATAGGMVQTSKFRLMVIIVKIKRLCNYAGRGREEIMSTSRDEPGRRYPSISR